MAIMGLRLGDIEEMSRRTNIHLRGVKEKKTEKRQNVKGIIEGNFPEGIIYSRL